VSEINPLKLGSILFWEIILLSVLDSILIDISFPNSHEIFLFISGSSFFSLSNFFLAFVFGGSSKLFLSVNNSFFLSLSKLFANLGSTSTFEK